MCNLSLYRKARPWQKRASELYYEGKSKPISWDCDVRAKILMDEMKKEGLVTVNEIVDDKGTVKAKGDYVVMHRKVGKKRHRRLMMRGNYIVDPGTNNKVAGLIMSWPKKIIWA